MEMTMGASVTSDEKNEGKLASRKLQFARLPLNRRATWYNQGPAWTIATYQKISTIKTTWN